MDGWIVNIIAMGGMNLSWGPHPSWITPACIYILSIFVFISGVSRFFFFFFKSVPQVGGSGVRSESWLS